MTFLNEEQQALRDAVRELAEGKIAPRAADIDKTGEFPHDIVDLLAQHDILALPFPVEFGGLGGDMVSILVVIEEISRVDASCGLIPAVQELGSLALLHAGTDEQKRRWVPDLAAGKI
ncbi:MAG TPA: acyl-CoA dehydrogenase family protein, partial [Candidatus Limnocylindria bacterium]|nr:acyl-CoA dehydrogenase family protein [Candidatus Limnocylindria bacterium]